jgi:biopolymer transport protein ExbD
MGMGGGSSRDKLQSDINVTPLVDVCLVLLIIFMVVTPMLQKGINVQLPVTDNPDKKPENSSQKLITVKWATPPQYYIEQRTLSKPDFQRELDEMYQRSPSTELVIKADQRLKYSDVKEVMKMTKDAGFQNVALIADKKTTGAAGGKPGAP